LLVLILSANSELSKQCEIVKLINKPHQSIRFYVAVVNENVVNQSDTQKEFLVNAAKKLDIKEMNDWYSVSLKVTNSINLIIEN
jgi:hypothetical protein